MLSPPRPLVCFVWLSFLVLQSSCPLIPAPSPVAKPFVCFSLRLMGHCSKGTRPEATLSWTKLWEHRVFAGLGPEPPYSLKPMTFYDYTFI